MRRIAVLALLTVGLVAGPARANGQPCADVTHHGYHAVGIVAHIITCSTADHVVRHVIDHGTPGLEGYACSRSFLPHNVTEWSCSRTVHGEKHGVKFGVRPVASATAASAGGCRGLTYGGFRATNIAQRAMGCYVAHLVVKHVVDHAMLGYKTLTCTRSGSAQRARWRCAGVLLGNPQSVTFVLTRRHAIARTASASPTSCADLRYHGYLGFSIRELGIGCEFARGLVRHAIDHGNSGFNQWHCTTHSSGTQTARWDCSGQENGARVAVGFFLRLTSRNPTH